MKNEELLGDDRNSSFGSTASILHSSLNMLSFQEHLERLCWQQGNRRQTAPAQRMAEPARDVVRPRPDCFAPALLAAPVHRRAPGQRFPAVWPQRARLPDQRRRDDSRGDPHVGTRPHRARLRHPAARPSARPLPLRRGGWLCRRHRLGGSRWRTVCRSRGAILRRAVSPGDVTL